MDQGVTLSLFSVTWAVIGFIFLRSSRRESSELKMNARFNELSWTIYGHAETKRESLIDNVANLKQRVDEIGVDVKFLRQQIEN